MKNKVVIGAAGVAGAVIVLGQIDVGAKDLATAPSATKGEVVLSGGSVPDVIVGDLHERFNYGADGIGNRVFSFGTTSCNIGNAPLAWVSNTNQHPVIAQNMFRVAPDPVNGHMRIEQLGQSWLKHGFFALAGSLCQPCQGTAGSALGVGCSDPYSATRNADQSDAGAKWQVNAATGFFPYPPQTPSPAGDPTVANLSYGRLKVAESDVLPSQNPNARWFGEGQYVHPQDSPQDGGLPNNASYREVLMNSSGNISAFAGATEREVSGLFAWVEVDASVKTGQVNADGTFFYGYNAYNNGDGTWDYEYAVQNHNSDRAGGSFSVAIPPNVNVTNIGFHDVDYHSGEAWDNTDWVVTVGASSVTWSSPESHAQNPNSNALRWGTLYNFRFTADTPPGVGTATLGYFKPGTPSSSDISVFGPTEGTPAFCAADIDGPGGGPDGNVDALDILLMIAQWGSPCVGSCEADISGPTPLVPDGNVDSIDFLLLIAQWGNPANCP